MKPKRKSQNPNQTWITIKKNKNEREHNPSNQEIGHFELKPEREKTFPTMRSEI